MQEVRFTCRVITPMFMAGADGRTPELRPSEFKGMMRFWWRAIKAEDNIKALREEEAKLFGGTRENEGKSKVSIRIIEDRLITNNHRPLPHSQNKTFTLPCIKENSVFIIVITSVQDIEFYKNLFLLSTILGGFGKRSRRGFGSIEVESVSSSLEYILSLLQNIKKDTYIIQNPKIIINNTNNTINTNNTNKSRNYPWIKKIEIGKNYTDINEVLTAIGNSSHNHRDPSLGNASPRMASPIYVSVIRQNSIYKPILTTLKSYFPQNYPERNFTKQNDFKRELL